jgi:hypothetical protein
MSVAMAETIIAIHAKRRVVFLSMISFFILSLSITASSVASLSYTENIGHLLPLSFLKTIFFISSMFLLSSFIFQFPWKHSYAYWKLPSISLRKPVILRNSSRTGALSVVDSMGINLQKKWQLRHPALSCIGYFLLFGLFFSGVMIFFGLPGEGVSFMVSRALLGYIAPVVIGSIFALFSLFCTVRYGSSKRSANSEMVYPSIFTFLLSAKNICHKCEILY